DVASTVDTSSLVPLAFSLHDVLPISLSGDAVWRPGRPTGVPILVGGPVRRLWGLLAHRPPGRGGLAVSHRHQGGNPATRDRHGPGTPVEPERQSAAGAAFGRSGAAFERRAFQ